MQHVQCLSSDWLACVPEPARRVLHRQTVTDASGLNRPLGLSLAVQPDCLNRRVVCGTVYGGMHLKYIMGSIVREGYCIPVPDFYLVLHGLRCRKNIIIQIMNGYECNGTDICMRWEMECSIQRGKAELNRTFHLSPNVNSCTIARMKSIHYLF